MQFYRTIHNSLHANELIQSAFQWLQRYWTWLTAVIWEGYLAIDICTCKIWIPCRNLIFNFRDQNISLEHSRLTSQCFPVINISDYTCLVIGKGDHINSYFLLTNLTTIDLFERGQTIKSFPDILKESWGTWALVLFKNIACYIKKVRCVWLILRK
jgi:hypothetical protein